VFKPIYPQKLLRFNNNSTMKTISSIFLLFTVPTVGTLGQEIGYQGIANSVGIKFDI
jgi:hypothetical protein